MITLTYAEAALIVASIALVLMIVVYLRNDNRWDNEYRTLQNRCRVDHEGWLVTRFGPIPPAPPMPPHLRGYQPINDDPREPNPPPMKP